MMRNTFTSVLWGLLFDDEDFVCVFVGQLEEDEAEEEIPNDTPCCKCQKTHQPEWVIDKLLNVTCTSAT